MKLFKRKPKIDPRDTRITDLEERNRTLANQVEYLVRTLRNMDGEIWNMTQRTDWESMRKHFVVLQEGMIARKVAESNRIGELLRPELIETYANPNNVKQIGSK